MHGTTIPISQNHHPCRRTGGGFAEPAGLLPGKQDLCAVYRESLHGYPGGDAEAI